MFRLLRRLSSGALAGSATAGAFFGAGDRGHLVGAGIGVVVGYLLREK